MVTLTRMLFFFLFIFGLCRDVFAVQQHSWLLLCVTRKNHYSWSWWWRGTYCYRRKCMHSCMVESLLLLCCCFFFFFWEIKNKSSTNVERNQHCSPFLCFQVLFLYFISVVCLNNVAANSFFILSLYVSIFLSLFSILSTFFTILQGEKFTHFASAHSFFFLSTAIEHYANFIRNMICRFMYCYNMIFCCKHEL